MSQWVNRGRMNLEKGGKVFEWCFGQLPRKPEGITYLCVADVLVTKWGKGA